MRKLTLLVMVVFMVSFFSIPAYSKEIKKTAQTGFQFLKVGMAARPAAMGGAYAMVNSGADAMFYNPAGITEMESGLDLFVNQTQWIAEITYSAGAVAKDLGNWGIAGISFISADYGQIIGTQVADTEEGFVETGNLDFGAYAVGVTYGRRLTDKFRIGGQIKYAYQKLGKNLMPDGETVKNEVSGLAYDFGTIFYPGFKSFRLGMNIRNFSAQLKYQEEAFELPLTFVIGFAMDMSDLIAGFNSPLLLSVDAIHPRDYSERIHVGAEYWVMGMLAVRAGYKFNYDEESISFGVGFKPTLGGIKLKVDYAYSEFGIFENVSRLSIGLSL